MAPIRRYLRISKYSVLECRIFLENPADGPRWLLNHQDPALPRVFEAVKPYVLPKLREENERAKGKGKKKKSVKDVVSLDEFDVSIFLTEIGTRHSLLVKGKTFKVRGPIKSSSGKLTGQKASPVMVREDSDDDDVQLVDVPMVDNTEDNFDPPRDDNEDFNRLEDDKKKLGFKTTYEGFSIWGLVLCLLVLMQDWISTQQPQNDEE